MNRCEGEAHELLCLPRARTQDRKRRRRHELEMVEDSTPAHVARTEPTLARDDQTFAARSASVATEHEEVVALLPVVGQRGPGECFERAEGHRSDGGLLEKLPAIHLISSFSLKRDRAID